MWQLSAFLSSFGQWENCKWHHISFTVKHSYALGESVSQNKREVSLVTDVFYCFKQSQTLASGSWFCHTFLRLIVGCFGCIQLYFKSYGSMEDIVIQCHGEIKLQHFNRAECHSLTEQAPVALRAYTVWGYPTCTNKSLSNRSVIAKHTELSTQLKCGIKKKNSSYLLQSRHKRIDCQNLKHW